MISCPVVECWQQRVLSCTITHTWDLALKFVAFLGSIGGWNWILCKWWDDGLFLKALNKHTRMWRLMCCMGCCRECQRGMLSWWVTTETRVLSLMSGRQHCTAASTSYLCASRMVILWLCLLCLFRHIWPCICWWWHGPTSYGEYWGRSVVPYWPPAQLGSTVFDVDQHLMSPSLYCMQRRHLFLETTSTTIGKIQMGSRDPVNWTFLRIPTSNYINGRVKWKTLRSPLKLWESVQQQLQKKRGSF